jgi:hypothetical protein
MRTLHRTTLLALLLAPLGLATSLAAQAATTYYVRTDGGNTKQCTGRSDAAYPGSGTGRACAWKHPFFALPPKGPPRIAGGDTLIIGGGSYMMGQGAPGAVNCGDASCYMSQIPSGPSASSKTRILGKKGTRPKLWATERAGRIINLEARSNIEVGNLEITDRSDCVFMHSVSSARCRSSSRPYGAWGRVGIYARASSNVWLHDLNIHGMAHMGINAGGLANWTVERVRINKNGRAGWDGNIGSSSSNSGRIVLRDVEIGWNGCGERWKTGEVWACWAQKTGGYGDGLGTYYTGGQWLIEDSFVHHNTSDGLDLRYMDGKEATTVTVRRLHAVGNAGNQAKIRGNAVVENSVLIGNCTYWKGKHYMLSGDICRASGNTLQFVLTSSDDVLVRHNTITGQGGVLVSAHEGDSATRIRMANNVLVGFPRWDDGSRLTSAYYTANRSVGTSWSGNLLWKVKNGFCPSGSVCGQHPKLRDMSLYSFDAKPLTGSPVRDRVSTSSAVRSDFLLQPRPSGTRSDIGAYEMQGSQ